MPAQTFTFPSGFVTRPDASTSASFVSHMFTAPVGLTLVQKAGGPLTKRIYLNGDGRPHSYGSTCSMSEGSARRVQMSNMRAFAGLIGNKIAQDQAIVLGSLRTDLPDDVRLTTRERLRNTTSISTPDLVTRTSDNIVYQPGESAIVLIDIDLKGMPDAVRERINGDYYGVLCEVMPELAKAASVIRASTSSCLERADTGEQFPGSGGFHLFVQIKDGRDADRFLKTLHDRCWLHGLGWFIVGQVGQMLERALIDEAVRTPERLVFEAAPIVEAPLRQDAARRQPAIKSGDVLDSLRACPPLTAPERAALTKLKDEAKEALRPVSAPLRDGGCARASR
jgi:hypothetical protein